MKLEPKPGQTITIFEQKFFFCEHPAHLVVPAPYSIEAGKAIVYQLKNPISQEHIALKVFKPKYQSSNVLSNIHELEKFKSLDGLKVCNRMCITKQNNPVLVGDFPELEYALLMPWIEGHTWTEVILKQWKVSEEASLEIAKKLLGIISSLEIAGYSHCDISGSNVILGCEITANNELILHDPFWIELIDIEDMFGPGLTDPTAYPIGTDGYQHVDGRTHPKGYWRDVGDRFSSAVLIAEILGWSKPVIRANSDKEHYFSLENMQDSSANQYHLMLAALDEVGEIIREHFETAWTSANLAECPSIAQWQAALVKSLNSLERLRTQMKKASKNGSVSEIVRLGDEIRRSNNALSYNEWGSYMEAQHKISTKHNLEQAISSGNEIQIISSFDKKTMTGAVSQNQRSLIGVAKRRITRWVSLKRAIDEADDKAICELFDRALFDDSTLISDDDMKIVERARERETAVLALRSAFATQDPQTILQSYPVDLLQDSNLLTHDDRQKLDEASQKLSTMPPNTLPSKSADADLILSLPNDEKDIIELWQSGEVSGTTLLSDVDCQRLIEARRKQGRVIRIQRALWRKDIKRVRQLYDTDELVHSGFFPADLRQQVEKFLSAH